MQTDYTYMTLAQIASCGSEEGLERELTWRISENDRRLSVADIEVVAFSAVAGNGSEVEIKVDYVLTEN